MTGRMPAGRATDAGGLEVAFEPVDPAQVVSGAPETRYLEVDEASGRSIGVWEHTPGVSTDVEADEVFVVLAGDGTLSFDEPPLAPVELRPGVIVRLEQGMRTVWSVRETLRKVYIAP